MILTIQRSKMIPKTSKRCAPKPIYTKPSRRHFVSSLKEKFYLASEVWVVIIWTDEEHR